MAENLRFTLSGRDELSRVLNGAGDSADRLRLRLSGITADADGRLRDLQGRFITTADAQRRLADTTTGTRDAFRRLSDETGKLGESLKSSLISLAPAAIPATAGLASSAAVLAGQLGAVAVAAGAYALALGPQIGAISEAAEAQEKYEQAVAESGRGSEAAVQAQVAYQRQLARMPPATREAAVAVGLLKDNYQEWSDSLAGDVMGPFTKGVAVANALLPKTTGLVKGTSAQFDRLITIVGGGISTPGFDALNQRFTDFSERTLRRGVDSLTLFLAKADAGELDDSSLSRWMDYARENGPLVGDTLENVGDALLNVLEAGSEVGAGMLQVINALSGIVSAVPPEAIATFLQLAIAIKAVRLAAAGTDAARAAMAALGVQIAAMRTSAAAAPGPLRGMGAAITGLSRTAKIAMAGTGLGLLLIGLDMIASKSQDAPPDVDKLKTSILELGQSGRVSGEAVRAYGEDLSGLADSLRTLARPSNAEGVQQWLTQLLGMDSTPVQKAKQDLDAVDKSLANLVSEGKADLAAVAFDRIAAAMRKQGMSGKELRAELDNYRDALESQRLEQELAAQAMGIFGQQALEVQAKLDAQKQSAEGLRQSIIALNDAHRSAYDAEIQFEASIDALTKAFAENGATLDLNTESGRENAQAMSSAAKAHDEMLASGLAAGESLGSMTQKSDTLRAKMLELAQATGMTDSQAREYVNTLLGTPGEITTAVNLEREEAVAGLREVQDEIRKTPGAKSVKVSTLNAAAIKALEAVGLKTRQLPDGRTEVYTANGQSLGAIGSVRAALDRLNGKTSHTWVVTHYQARREGSHGAQLRFAEGGLIGRYATGGGLDGGGGLLRGPGSGTSDSIPIWASTGEYVVKAAAVARYGEKFMDALNSGRIPVGRSAPSAGKAAAVGAAAAAATSAEPPVTFNVYPRKSVIDANDLRLIQRQEDARLRVRRPR